jgi:enoyl-CoA hydratase
MIELREEQGIAVLELAHGRANALDLELCEQTIEMLGRLEQDDVPALVITGRGTIFCAGVDLVRLLDGGPNYAREFVPALVTAFRSLFTFPRPVIAAMNGHAVAGGCVLACAADRRLIADTGARVGVPELRVGVPFPASAIEIMRMTLTPPRFRSLIYGGATLEPAEAQDWGLVDEVVTPDQLLPTALANARDLASIPAAAFRITKLQMRMPTLQQIDTADREYAADILRLWTDQSTFDYVRAYVDRTLRRSKA